jgi:hypothetical protein
VVLEMSDWYESTKLCKKKIIRMRLKKKENKAAHFVESNSDRQRPHFGRVACQIGPSRRLFPKQRSQEHHGEEQIDCAVEQDEKVDEETGDRQMDGKTAVMVVSVREKKRNAGSLEGMQASRGVLG